MLKVEFGSKFKKDYRRCLKRGCKREDLAAVLEFLMNGRVLPPKYRDHALVSSRNYVGVRECHIKPD